MDRHTQLSLSDVDEHARIATNGAAEAVTKVLRLERTVDRHEERITDLEEAQRPSRVDSEFEARVLEAIKSAQTKSSYPPDIDLQSGKSRVRGSSWVVVTVMVLLVLFAAVWQGPEIVKALK